MYVAWGKQLLLLWATSEGNSGVGTGGWGKCEREVVRGRDDSNERGVYICM